MPLLEKVENLIGYTFKDKELLRRCFTHSSYANENNLQSNERLEFLGDKILGFITAESLYLKNLDFSAGDLTKQQQQIVSKTPLASSVKELGLQNFLIMGKGESTQNLSEKAHSDIFEALVAGIYLDGGLRYAQKFILKNLKETGIEASSISLLQEFLQQHKLAIPDYKLIKKTGKDNNPKFYVSLCIDGKQLATGCGKSKQAAKADAANSALKILLKNPPKAH